jgi:nucleosome binding factor SPN SPT16 subunit
MIHWNAKLTACSSVDIPLAEGPVNLNWGPIMKTINDSPYDFFRGGGWTFLGGTGDEVESPFPSRYLFCLAQSFSERTR